MNDEHSCSEKNETLIISRNAPLEPVGTSLFVFPKHLESQQILLTVSSHSEDSSVPNKAGTDIVLADHVLPRFLKKELSELFLHVNPSNQLTKQVKLHMTHP
ncbi:hypothetical protein T12_4658 [Trichinella patagoniensis]|uniref:Uncharacterized protein n=1 Tax=Trichinella patagoniensis TaxID=990121 RepID=A0A0V1ADB6_9BILA|nr:hypothetical protein T12_4658 [Trichinella patagoniensis]